MPSSTTWCQCCSPSRRLSSTRIVPASSSVSPIPSRARQRLIELSIPIAMRLRLSKTLLSPFAKRLAFSSISNACWRLSSTVVVRPSSSSPLYAAIPERRDDNAFERRTRTL